MLPTVRPMLAVAAAPFDAADYLFEVKWDGVRALAAVDDGHWRLWGREQANYTARYPELDVLRRLPSGTLVDGELVVLRDGRADLNALLRRHPLASPQQIHHARTHLPVQYVLFDLLYHQGRSLLRAPLQQRRERLAELLTALREPLLPWADGVVGTGRDWFARVVGQGHEGVMAKHLASSYRPGRRCASWRKIKPRQLLPCVIIGYTPAPAGFAGLLVAAVRDGALRYVGELTAGFRATDQERLGPSLSRRTRPRPVVPCGKRARWVEPELYCLVQFQQWTPQGLLRGASFRGVLSSDRPAEGSR